MMILMMMILILILKDHTKKIKNITIYKQENPRKIKLKLNKNNK
jgi:hypothetical protein